MQYTTAPPLANGSAGGPGELASEGGFSPGLLPAHVNVAVRDSPYRHCFSCVVCVCISHCVSSREDTVFLCVP